MATNSMAAKKTKAKAARIPLRTAARTAAKPAAKDRRNVERPDAQTSRVRELDDYAKAMELFAARKYESAESLFRQLGAAANIEIAHAARTRLLMCQQRRRVSD
ncbi:MAG: hypothetical protein ABL995_19305 [Bryobacteraceae bacterium]